MRRAQPWKTARARTLRANETSAEAMLWRALRNRQLGGHKFSRQVAVGPYFADFMCRQLRLVVEIDGATHGTPTEIASDEMRTAFLHSQGYRIFRVDNATIYGNLGGVLDGLLRFADGEEA